MDRFHSPRAVDQTVKYAVNPVKTAYEGGQVEEASMTANIAYRTEDAARVDRIFDRLAISEHPDVAHIKSEIIRAKEEKGAENPTKARKERQPSPSAPTSKGKGDTAGTKPSIRSPLRDLRKDRASAPVKSKKPVKGKTGPGR